MKGSLKNILKKFEVNSSKNTMAISKYLLEKEPIIKKIVDFKKIMGVSLSSAHHFIKKIGYPTFTHFLYDYNNVNYVFNKESKYHMSIEEKANEFAKIIGNKKIFIATSRRAKSLGKFLAERLNDGGIQNLYYSESKMDQNWFIKQSQKSILLIFDVTGYSNQVKKFLRIIETEIPKSKTPTIILITAASTKEIMKYKNHFSIGEIESANHPINNWLEYNEILLKLFEFVHYFLKSIYKIRYVK